eukprot:CAMPEP_0184314924 /NCGR_PEP_ID=MMETSP1049-20130417/78552_1 /TAXON_ID=77928 /ORGANISM="Proteomonas sulcata, Strain CCMP704" /LENGTH=34 /DNA_ID= /DNA_START= /DNA_END= /DNA_ORIENTATION=
MHSVYGAPMKDEKATGSGSSTATRLELEFGSSCG